MGSRGPGRVRPKASGRGVVDAHDGRPFVTVRLGGAPRGRRGHTRLANTLLTGVRTPGTPPARFGEALSTKRAAKNVLGQAVSN